MSLIFHVFVSDVNQGNEDFGCKKVGSRFPCAALLLLSLLLLLLLLLLSIYFVLTSVKIYNRNLYLCSFKLI